LGAAWELQFEAPVFFAEMNDSNSFKELRCFITNANASANVIKSTPLYSLCAGTFLHLFIFTLLISKNYAEIKE
jgi:hypothetical protein